MKKYLLPFLLALVFIGCSSKDAANSEDIKMKAEVAEKPYSPGAAKVTALVDKIENKTVTLKINKIHIVGRQTPKINKGNTVVVTYKLDTKIETGKIYDFKIQSSIVPGSDKPHWSVKSVKEN